MLQLKNFLKISGIVPSIVSKIEQRQFNAMKEAILSKSISKVIELKKKGYCGSFGGENLLHFAIRQKDTKIVLQIIETFQEISLEDKTNNGDTALVVAIMQNDIELVMLLINKGANVNSRQNQGSTPAIIASANGFIDILQYLLNNGANLDAQNFEGQTALHRACFYGNLEIVRFLINEKKQRILRCDKKGNTCVHMAAAGLSIRVLRYLRSKLKDLSVFQQKNQQGFTPYDILQSKFNFIRDNQLPKISRDEITQYLDDQNKPVLIQFSKNQEKQI